MEPARGDTLQDRLHLEVMELFLFFFLQDRLYLEVMELRKDSVGN